MPSTLQQIPSGTFQSAVPFPPDWPPWLVKSAVGAETVEYGGSVVTYAVAKRNYSADARNFLGFVAIHGDYILVSQDVPAEWRPLYALHEIIEMTELKGKPGHCLEALKRELALVPPELSKHYVSGRTIFFMQLIDFHELAGTLAEDALAEMRASHAYLLALR